MEKSPPFYLGIPLVLLVYVFAYFPFASLFAQSRWSREYAPALIVMLLLGIVGRRMFLPRTAVGRVALWLFYISWVVSFLGVLGMSGPQAGHPPLGAFVMIALFGLQGLLIPLTLLLLLIDLPKGRNAGFTATGLAYLLVASYFFSGARYGLPSMFDAFAGTKFFTRGARRLDLAPADYNEIAADPELLDRKRLLDGDYQYQLDTAAMRGGPEMKARVLEAIERGLPDIPDLEYQRRALMKLAEIHPGLRPDARCPHDLVPFLLKVMEKRQPSKRDTVLSDIACGELMRGLRPLISNTDYPDLAPRLEAYLLDRQLHPPQDTRLPDGSYMYATPNAVSEIIVVTNALQAVQTPSAGDRLAARNLACFVPYLEARGYCRDLIQKIEALPTDASD